MTLRFDVEVSLALGADLTADPGTWSWTDVTAFADGDVEIHRGRGDWQSQVQPSWCTVTLDNADGRFSRLNPVGAYYGQLAKNTPLRIRACEAGGSLVTRFVGYVSEWPPRWTPGQKYQWVPVRADGVLRRLGQGATPTQSAIKRTIQRVAGPVPVAYWPLEDGFAASVAGSGTPGTGPMSVAGGEITFANDETLPGSAATPDMTAGALRGRVTGGGSSTAWFVEFWLKANFTGGSRAAYFFTSSADVETWGIRQPASASGQFDVFVLDSGGSTIASLAGTVTDWTEGEWHHFAITAEQNGSNIDTLIYSEGVAVGGGPITTATLGRVTDVFANDFDAFDFADLLSVAHVAVGDGTTITDSYLAGDGYAGESASDRVERTADEAGVPVVITAGDSAVMGPQRPETLLGIWRDCEAADHGVVDDALTGEFAYKPLSARYGLTPALELDHDEGHIVDIAVADDDRLTRNDITVTRTNGTSARAADEDSITAAGHYRMGLTLNLYTDDQPEQHASWLLHLGTVDEYRYPRIELALHKSSDLVVAWLAADTGSRVTIDNMPANPSPDLVDQVVEGYTERINSVAYQVSINLSPYSPYNVGEYQDTDASGDVPRYDGDQSTTSGDFDTGTDATLTVATSAGPLWTTAPPGGFPILIRVAGAVLSVTNITGGSSPQTFTVSTTVPNGVIKTIPSGSEVHVATKAYYGL